MTFSLEGIGYRAENEYMINVGSNLANAVLCSICFLFFFFFKENIDLYFAHVSMCILCFSFCRLFIHTLWFKMTRLKWVQMFWTALWDISFLFCFWPFQLSYREITRKEKMYGGGYWSLAVVCECSAVLNDNRCGSSLSMSICSVHPTCWGSCSYSCMIFILSATVEP